jgi:hypothetical protein
MKNKNLILPVLISGIALATAWAVRGQFGHEHGASWAGAIGCMTVVLMSGRADWMKNSLNAILAGGIGWGIGGIMSYGILVGYCRSTDFGNVYYGFLTLFVVGALYGFVGGGLFGISLSKEKDKKAVAWPQLIVEMTIGAVLAYFFIIEQFGYYMTPPRSELWAACFGIALAITWYMIRNKMNSALRVATYSALGAGFGFALGNLFQVIGHAYEVKFNMWNVMEYTLGFCGGIGMSYAVFTSKWEELEAPSKKSWILPIVVLLLVIPSIMWDQNVELEKINSRIMTLATGLPDSLPYYILFVPFLLFLAMTGYWVSKFSKDSTVSESKLFSLYIAFFGLYILLSIIKTGAFISTHRIEQYLYLVNFAVILYFIRGLKADFTDKATDWKKVTKGFVLMLLAMVAIALIAVNSHDVDLSGTNYRFGEFASHKE